MECQEAAHRQQQQVRDIDIDDLMDDPELERLHAERLATMQRENEKRQQLQRKGHGEYQEVEEGQLQLVLCCSSHRRCRFANAALLMQGTF